jgi:hypothetical protein
LFLLFIDLYFIFLYIIVVLKYNEYGCHELNIFLYNHDQLFFQNIIKPYLNNKLELQFIDHWLLEHDLISYISAPLFKQLNIFEQILLAQRLPKYRSQIIDYISNLSDANEISRQNYLRIFEVNDKKNNI